MALKYFFTALLSVLISRIMVEASAVKDMPCENHRCPVSQECYLKENPCSHPPCPLTPACRLSCSVIDCGKGLSCVNGKCVKSCREAECDPGEECVLEKVECFTTPCPPIPTCKPIDKCALVRCRSGYVCDNGNCIQKPTCVGFPCKRDEECYLKDVTCI